ncbi:MAG TPA: hypothetical protein VNU46_07325 [Gemmatimonadaceae bacterium]|jgi:hypothetical protein|nr:hypothetical protein [Gemmatimonadaceae bacterium]
MLSTASTTTIRVSTADRDIVQELATALGRTQQEVVHEAVERFRRNQLLQAMNAGFVRLRATPGAWEGERTERADWDITLEETAAE